MNFWKFVAMVLFFLMLLEFMLEFHYFFFGNFPMIISSKKSLAFEMCKTSICIAFLYGIWKGYI